MTAHDKFIRTSRYELWQRLRLGALAVPPFNLWHSWGTLEGRFSAGVSSVDDRVLGLAAASSILVLQILLISFVPVFAWWVACTFLMMRSRREASFSPTRDLEYYREKLCGLTAVQVSLLADLRMEPREDAAATLLSLVLGGALAIEGDHLRIADADAVRELSRSDRTLVRLAMAGALGPDAYGEWARQAEDEAVDGVHLRRVGARDRVALVGLGSLLEGCGMGCLLVAALSGLFAVFSASVGKGLMDLFDLVEDDYEMVPYLVDNPLLLVELVAMVIIAMVMLVGLLMPVTNLVRGLVENNDASRHLQRTALGEQETELVYGIRNYLRDFTALSEADKGALAIWDDFLVYAVALGQNGRAVNELLGMRGLHGTPLGL